MLADHAPPTRHLALTAQGILYAVATADAFDGVTLTSVQVAAAGGSKPGDFTLALRVHVAGIDHYGAAKVTISPKDDVRRVVFATIRGAIDAAHEGHG